jgi:hypothetical protein
MGPVDAAGNKGIVASGEWEMAARAGIAGSKLSVAALAEVCFRNERLVNFVTVLSFPRDVVKVSSDLQPMNVASAMFGRRARSPMPIDTRERNKAGCWGLTGAPGKAGAIQRVKVPPG